MGTIIVCIILIAIVVLVIRYLIKNKRNGKTACGTCNGCAYAANCHGGSTTTPSQHKRHKAA